MPINNEVDEVKESKDCDLNHDFILISPSMAKLNKKYESVFRNMFDEQAARIVQTKWREKKGKTYQGKYNEKVVNSQLSLRFIKEPISDTKAKLYAEKINKGAYCVLDFHEPQFVRNLYKALRLDLISPNQLADTLLLRSIIEQFHASSIKKYSFTEKGPLNLETISYATENQLGNFRERIKELPKSEQCYFSVNVPKTQLLAFLFLSLSYFSETICESCPSFKIIFEKYLEQLTIDLTKKEELISSARKLPDQESRMLLMKFLMDHEVSHHTVMTMMDEIEIKDKKSSLSIRGKYTPCKESSNIRFLLGLLHVSEEMPVVGVSPDFDPSDPESPVLCFNLMTISAFNKLQLAIFGEEDVVYPYFTAGQFDPRMIRYLDEKPQMYGMEHPSRPVEIIQSDLIRSKTYHRYKAFDFMGAFHDLFHTWKCSANPLKPFIRYLTALETMETGFDMSKIIWALTDRDFIIANKLRIALKKGDQKGIDKELENNFLLCLIVLGLEDSNAFSFRDNNLLFLADMIINKAKWKTLTGVDPEKFFQSAGYQFHIVKNIYYNLLSELINQDYTKTGTYKSHKYYILMFRLKRMQKASDYDNALQLCEKMDSHLDKIFHWQKNEGLFVTKNLKIQASNLPLTYLEPVQIYEILLIHSQNLIYENHLELSTENKGEKEQTNFLNESEIEQQTFFQQNIKQGKEPLQESSSKSFCTLL